MQPQTSKLCRQMVITCNIIDQWHTCGPLSCQGSMPTGVIRFETELIAILQYLNGILQVWHKGLLYDMVHIMPVAPSLPKV